MTTWFDIPAMRDRYNHLLGQLDLFENAGIRNESRKTIEAECWEIRKAAYNLLAGLRDEGQDVETAAGFFGWSPRQLDSTVLRSWLKSERTPVVSTRHSPLGTEGLWHTPDRHTGRQQLPAYVQNTAKALMRDEGMEESQAIATAINAVKSWARGEAFGGKVKVTPEVQQAAQRALDEWNQLKESHH